jgi:hypothetical protein
VPRGGAAPHGLSITGPHYREGEGICWTSGLMDRLHIKKRRPKREEELAKQTHKTLLLHFLLPSCWPTWETSAPRKYLGVDAILFDNKSEPALSHPYQ